MWFRVVDAVSSARGALTHSVARTRSFSIKLARNEDGYSLIMTALALPAIIGLAALSLDGTILGHTRLTLQGAADSAAVSAAALYSGTPSAINSTLQTEANAIAAKYGIVNGTNGTVTLYHPPQSGTGNCTLAASDA